MTETAAARHELALVAAEGVAGVLPSVDPLTVSAAQPGTEHVTALFEGAVVVDLDGPGGTIAVLVSADLVEALASSPMGQLDLAAAVQPALDAAAVALGTTARAARQVALEELLPVIGEPFTVVPLIGAGIAAAVALSDSTLDGISSYAGSAPAAAPASAPAPAAAAPQPVAMQDVLAAEQPVAPVTSLRGFEMLHGVTLDVTVELGRTQLTVRELLALTPGAVLGLDRVAGSPADVLVNGRLIARGEVVVVDEDFGLRVTEIVHDRAAS